MKILKITLLTIISMCAMTSCSSDDDAPTTQTNAELIIGTWKWTAYKLNGETIPLSECDLLDTLTFNVTQAVYVSNDSVDGNAPCNAESETSTYSITGNTITEDDGFEVTSEEIVTLNQTTLVLSYQEIDGDVTYNYLDTYTRQ